MIVPREVFLKFYLLNYYREYTLDVDAGEWKNKKGNQHNEDSKEWWLVTRIENNTTVEPALEITATAKNIDDVQLFYRIYGRYGIKSIKQKRLKLSVREIRAIGAALKYMQWQLSPDATFDHKILSTEEIEFLEAKQLFLSYLQQEEYKHFLTDYPELAQSLFSKNSGSEKLQEEASQTEKFIEKEIVISTSRNSDANLHSILDKSRVEEELLSKIRKEQEAWEADKQLVRLCVKKFFQSLGAGKCLRALEFIHPFERQQLWKGNIEAFEAEWFIYVSVDNLDIFNVHDYGHYVECLCYYDTCVVIQSNLSDAEKMHQPVNLKILEKIYANAVLKGKIKHPQKNVSSLKFSLNQRLDRFQEIAQLPEYSEVYKVVRGHCLKKLTFQKFENQFYIKSIANHTLNDNSVYTPPKMAFRAIKENKGIAQFRPNFVKTMLKKLEDNEDNRPNDNE